MVEIELDIEMVLVKQGIGEVGVESNTRMVEVEQVIVLV